MSNFFSRFSKKRLSIGISVVLLVAICVPLITQQFLSADDPNSPAVTFQSDTEAVDTNNSSLYRVPTNGYLYEAKASYKLGSLKTELDDLELTAKPGEKNQALIDAYNAWLKEYATQLEAIQDSKFLEFRNAIQARLDKYKESGASPQTNSLSEEDKAMQSIINSYKEKLLDASADSISSTGELKIPNDPNEIAKAISQSQASASSIQNLSKEDSSLVQQYVEESKKIKTGLLQNSSNPKDSLSLFGSKAQEYSTKTTNADLKKVFSASADFAKRDVLSEETQKNVMEFDQLTKKTAEILDSTISAHKNAFDILNPVSTTSKNLQGLTITREQYNSFFEQGKKLVDGLAQKSEANPVPSTTPLTKAEVDKFEGDALNLFQSTTGMKLTDQQSSQLKKNIAGLLTMPTAKDGYDQILYGAEFAKLKNYGTANQTVYFSMDNPLRWVFIAYYSGSQNLKDMLAQKGWTAEKIEKASGALNEFYSRLNYIDGMLPTSSDKPAADPAISNSSDSGSTLLDTTTVAEDQIIDLKMLTQATDSVNEASKQGEKLKDFAVTINNAINNGLNGNLYGREYIGYLQAKKASLEIARLKQANTFCGGKTAKALVKDTNSTIGKQCNQIMNKFANAFEIAGKTDKFGYTSLEGGTNSFGNLSMNPRTGHMEYNTVVYSYDNTGVLKIAGEMTFDPINQTTGGNLSYSFGDSMVTLYSDALTGDLYAEYTNKDKPLEKLGNLITVNTIAVAKDGSIGGKFELFNRLMNFNPNTKKLELRLTGTNSPAELWIDTEGKVRGTYNVKVGNDVNAGLGVDSRGNFTISFSNVKVNNNVATGITMDSQGHISVPVSFVNNGTTYGSLSIGSNGKIGGSVDMGKIIKGGDAASIFVGIDKGGVNSVGVPIGSFAGKPFSFSIGKDGSLSFGGFIPVGPVPVPIGLGQDARGNVVLSWPGGHFTLGHETRPTSAPVPKMKADKSGYDASTIWYRHSFKKGFKVVRVYNTLTKITPEEQKQRSETIFKVYNELLKRNPSISEFLNWYFYMNHEIWDPGKMEAARYKVGGTVFHPVMKKEAPEKTIARRTKYLESSLRWLLKKSYSDVVPSKFRFPNGAEYKWIQAGNDPLAFPKRPQDILTVNPFGGDLATKVQEAAKDPNKISEVQGQVSSNGVNTSFKQLTDTVNTEIKNDTESAKNLQKAQASL